MKNKKYTVRVNCPCFQDINVIAKTEDEAIEMAEHEFQCAGNAGGDSSEVLSRGEFVFDCYNRCNYCNLTDTCPDAQDKAAQ